MRTPSLAALLFVQFAIAVGQPPPAFNPWSMVPVTSPAVGADTADLRKIGRRDVVTAHILTSDVHVALALGGGAFAPAVSYPVGGFPYFVKVVDGDGGLKPDILVALPGSTSAAVFF